MNYFGVRELDAEREVLLATLEALQQAEQLTELRMKGGLATDYDVYQARTLLDQTKAQAQHIEIQRAQLEHVIAVLTGQSPSSFSLARNALREGPPVIPAGLPSQLLERRPDIQSIERTMAASSAQIGVARARSFRNSAFREPRDSRVSIQPLFFNGRTRWHRLARAPWRQCLPPAG